MAAFMATSFASRDLWSLSAHTRMSTVGPRGQRCTRGSGEEHRDVPRVSQDETVAFVLLDLDAARPRALAHSVEICLVVQWRRPTLSAGAGGTPSPRQTLKPRW